jgi:hypothetical protein
MSNSQDIFVRFIDGVDVFIPIPSLLASKEVYQLLPNPEFDYDDDTILFEYGSDDKVKVSAQQFSNGSSGLVANELVESGDPRNVLKRNLFIKAQNIGHL